MQNRFFIFIKTLLISAVVVLLPFTTQAASSNTQKTIQTHANQLFHAGSPAEGNPAGDVVIVDFFDYQCSHCKELSETLKAFIKKDSGIHVIFKEFPIIGENSEYASKAALAAAKQGQYLTFHTELMNMDSLTKDQILAAANKLGLNMKKFKQDINSKSVAQELRTNLALSTILGINGTPTLIIASSKDVKGHEAFIIPGALSEGELADNAKKVRG